MTFPLAEVKFSRLLRTAYRTACLVRLYWVQDGGLDADGRQIFLRLLKREHVVDVDQMLTKAQLLTTARAKLDQLIADNGWMLAPEQIIVSLG